MSGAGRIVALARRELGCLTHNLDRLWAVGHMPIGHRFGPGLLLGVVAARAVVTRTIGQVERLLATPVADSPGLAPLGIGSDEERSHGVEVLRESCTSWAVSSCNRSRSSGWRWRAGSGTPTRPKRSPRSKGRPGGRLESREAILARARGQVARCWDALPDWFGRLPGRNCEVTPVDLAHEDDLSEYYLAGTTERAGTYFVNTRAPRPAHDLAATSFHEANPGHHLQTALEKEAPDRHALRRNAGELQGAAFGGSWGLSSERLADEMGLYADDAERLGVLEQQALRAARLVVDTGIHAFGWTRERSIATMRASGCDGWLAASETDRYSAIPGQALTYSVPCSSVSAGRFGGSARR